MSFIKVPSGEYYYFFIRNGNTEYMVKNSPKYKSAQGYIGIAQLATPKELIGKKVRIKLEIIDKEVLP